MSPRLATLPDILKTFSTVLQELLPVSDCCTLAEMEMHTGFSLAGWDLTVAPDYWPPVKQGPDGGLEIH